MKPSQAVKKLQNQLTLFTTIVKQLIRTNINKEKSNPLNINKNNQLNSLDYKNC